MGEVRGASVGVGIFHKRDDIILPIRLPQEQGYASISSFYISAGSHVVTSFFFPPSFFLRFQPITPVDHFDCFIAVVLITAQQLEYLNVHLCRHYA